MPEVKQVECAVCQKVGAWTQQVRMIESPEGGPLAPACDECYDHLNESDL